MSKKYLTQELMTEVESLLRRHESLRSNDKRLVFNIWLKILRKKISEADYEKLSSVLRFLLESDIPPIESITRARRKLQELHPELQKNKSKKRDLEKQVRSEVKEQGE